MKHDVTVSVVNLYTDEAGNAAVPTKFAAAQRETAAPAPVVRRSAARKTEFLFIAGLIFILMIGAVLWHFSHQTSTKSKTVASTGTAPSVSALGPAISEKSIAVLPFENLSSDKENAFFAQGIQDEIITTLSKISGLRVISRTSTERYKSAPENLPEIAHELRVANILEGSVQKSGDRVHINVQLIQADSDAHLWAQSYDRQLIDIFGPCGADLPCKVPRDWAQPRS